MRGPDFFLPSISMINFIRLSSRRYRQYSSFWEARSQSSHTWHDIHIGVIVLYDRSYCFADTNRCTTLSIVNLLGYEWQLNVCWRVLIEQCERLKMLREVMNWCRSTLKQLNQEECHAARVCEWDMHARDNSLFHCLLIVLHIYLYICKKFSNRKRRTGSGNEENFAWRSCHKFSIFRNKFVHLWHGDTLSHIWILKLW